MKKVLSIVLSLCMLLSIAAGLNLTSYAQEYYSEMGSDFTVAVAIPKLGDTMPTRDDIKLLVSWSTAPCSIYGDIIWSSDGITLSQNYTATEKAIYTCTIKLKANDGYYFTQESADTSYSVRLTLGGMYISSSDFEPRYQFEVNSADPSEMTLYVSYKSQEYIHELNFEGFPAPVVGEKFGTIVPSPMVYISTFIDGPSQIDWYDEDGYIEYWKENVFCEAGKAYRAEFEATIYDNIHEFSKDVTVTVNGKPAEVISSSDKFIRISVIFRKASSHTHTLEKTSAVASTCTKTGLTEGSRCSVCGKVIKAQTTVAKKAHTYKDVVTKANATTKANGKITPTCTVCGAKKTATTIYYPKTVTLSKTSYVYDGKAKKPTVTVKDSKGNKIASSNYSVSYSNNTKAGKATVKITFKGNYGGTISKTFTIAPKATTISTVTAASKAFTVKWKKQATETTGYEIQYSTDKNFKKGNKTVTVSKNSTTSKKVNGLKAKTKYYVHIRTYKTVKVNGKSTKIYSTWSKAKTVTTKK